MNLKLRDLLKFVDNDTQIRINQIKKFETKNKIDETHIIGTDLMLNMKVVHFDIKWSILWVTLYIGGID